MLNKYRGTDSFDIPILIPLDIYAEVELLSKLILFLV